MVKAVGGHVFTLKRVSIGRLTLDPTLPLGECRLLSEQEIALALSRNESV